MTSCFGLGSVIGKGAWSKLGLGNTVWCGSAALCDAVTVRCALCDAAMVVNCLGEAGAAAGGLHLSHRVGSAWNWVV